MKRKIAFFLGVWALIMGFLSFMPNVRLAFDINSYYNGLSCPLYYLSPFLFGIGTYSLGLVIYVNTRIANKGEQN